MVPRHSPNRQTFPQFGSFSTPRTVKADDAEGAQTTRGSDASGHAPSAYQAAAQQVNKRSVPVRGCAQHRAARSLSCPSVQGRMAAIALGDIHRTCMVMANPDVVTAAQARHPATPGLPRDTSNATLMHTRPHALIR